LTFLIPRLETRVPLGLLLSYSGLPLTNPGTGKNGPAISAGAKKLIVEEFKPGEPGLSRFSRLKCSLLSRRRAAVSMGRKPGAGEGDRNNLETMVTHRE
jgi:hypothetical protein